jgi:hypothetical protein
MQFLTFDQAEIQPFQSQYRYSVVNALVALLVTLVFTTGFGIAAFKAWKDGTWMGVLLFGWIGLWCGVFVLFANMIFRARRLPTNWLVRAQTDGLLMKYRSYLNHHFPADDQTVAFVPFAEIEWVREHRITSTVPGGTRGDDTSYRYRYAEFKVPEDLATELSKHVDAEMRQVAPRRSGWISGSSRSSHYPVQAISGGLIRVEWGVKPSLKHFLNEMKSRIEVKEKLGTSIDFRKIQNMSKAEQEQHLLELIETGDRISAVKVVKRLYKFNTTEAMRFVDEFTMLPGKNR